jgi:hypothetical protein
MIPEKAKKKLVEELEKRGNIFFSCAKVGIGRSTFYRWKKADDSFRQLVEELIQYGREDMCDVAEQALMLKVKEKDMTAIKYLLGHNSDRYRQKRTSTVVIEHRRVEPPASSVRGLEDDFDDLRKKEEVVEILEKIANENGLEVNEEILKVLSKEVLRKSAEPLEGGKKL